MTADALETEPPLVRAPLTREQFDILVDAGVFEEQHVELIGGELIEVPPQGPEHVDGMTEIAYALHDLLRDAFGDRYRVRQQGSLAASDLSEPQPDVLVVDRADSNPRTHPRSAHLAVEVCRTSRRLDLGRKPLIYAGADITEYWVVDLPRRQVVRHRDPLAAEGRYARVDVLPLDTDLEVLGVTVNVARVLG